MIGTGLPHEVRLSPNINDRQGSQAVSILVLHYTGMETAAKACDWLCDARSEVSCHYLVDELGNITQMVDEGKRAWHAGISSWHGETDINSRSIGIEIQNPGHGHGYGDFPAEQMLRVAALCKDIITRHSIPQRNVLAHSDVAPGRKIDPGEKFDWAFLAAHGVGHWVQPAMSLGGSFLQFGDEGEPVKELQTMLKLYGYGLDITSQFDARTRLVVEAFQRHFCQIRIDGIVDSLTRLTLHQLCQKL